MASVGTGELGMSLYSAYSTFFILPGDTQHYQPALPTCFADHRPVLVGSGGFWCTGGFWWVLVGSGGLPSVVCIVKLNLTASG